jgi:hypothetical protein
LTSGYKFLRVPSAKVFDPVHQFLAHQHGSPPCPNRVRETLPAIGIYFLSLPLISSFRAYIFTNAFRYRNLNEKQFILICCIPKIQSLFLTMVQTPSNEIG